jgi:hypothetical protein
MQYHQDECPINLIHASPEVSARYPPPGKANIRADDVICLPFHVRSLTSPVLCNLHRKLH